MIDMSPWSSCSCLSPWLGCSGHTFSSAGPSVSPFRDFFLGILVHMWFRHRWKFCVFHHKKRVKFCIFFDKQLRVCLPAVRNKYSWYCHCYWFRPIGEYWWILILATATALTREGCWVTSQKQTLKHPWELFSPTPFTELERMLPSKDRRMDKAAFVCTAPRSKVCQF